MNFVPIGSFVSICEVGPRDGLQIAKTRMTTDDKVAWIVSLAAAGIREVEVGSFVPPRVIPQLADTAEVEALVPSAEQAMGQLDILVANAGITRDNLFVQLRDEDWDEVIKVNLTATFRLARAATKLMMRKRFGRIIAITSVVGVTGNPGQGNYTASKAGLIGMIKTLGAEYARRNVTANCIAPGFIKTPMTDVLNDKQRESILARVPAARLGTPDEIAAAAVYLSSNEAAYVTGQTLHVNGGMAMF